MFEPLPVILTLDEVLLEVFVTKEPVGSGTANGRGNKACVCGVKSVSGELHASYCLWDV